MIRAALLSLALFACTAHDTVAVGGGDRQTYCDGSGPPTLLDPDGGQICAAELANRAFGRALCACGSYPGTGGLTVDSFDSRQGPYAPGGAGGDVGIDQGVDTSGDVDIGGDLTVAGAAGLLGGASLAVGGDLQDQGDLGRATTSVTVGGDATVGGDIDLASLQVTDTLNVTPTATVQIRSGSVGATASGPVDVAPPCDCQPGGAVDVPGLVEAHRYDNHDADIGLDPLALSNLTATTELVLPCGRFFVDRVRGGAGVGLTLRVTGRAALFIGQGVTLDDDLDIQLDGADAELDLFIAGAVNTAGFVVVGDPDAPARTRIYVGGAGSLNLSANATVAGNLYAPLVDLAVSAPLELYGAAFVHQLVNSAAVDIHYDRAITAAPDPSCP